MDANTTHTRRFADAELENFHQEFLELKSEFETFRTERQEQQNALDRNTQAVETISKNVEGLVEAWNSATGFLRVIGAISKAMKVLAPIAAFIAAVWYFVHNGHWPEVK